MRWEDRFIGSGDIKRLMMGYETKGYLSLVKEFMTGEKPVYNSYQSPINQLRCGKILEDVFLSTLPVNYMGQWKCERGVLKVSLDCACIEKRDVVEFIEVKTVNLVDYLELLDICNSSMKGDILLWDYLPEIIKKKYKEYYNQVQAQLYAARNKKCKIVFLCVVSYDDRLCWSRSITSNDFIEVVVNEDITVQEEINNRLIPFDYWKKLHTNTLC